MDVREFTEILSEIENITDRRVRFLGIFSEAYHSETGKWPILVGGCAVEIYTQGHRATGDMDLLCDLETAARILTKWGFENPPLSRDLIHRELDLYVETVGTGNVNEDQEATERIVFMSTEDDGFKFALISIEDLVIDRLNAAKHWDSQDDRIWATVLLSLGQSYYNIDMGYVRRKAGEPQNDCLDLLEELTGDTGPHP